MLACARIGAPHSVVFGGFSAEALRDRINDAGAKLVVTADGGYRRGAAHALKPAVDEALAGAPACEKVICVRRTGSPVAMREGRDLWWHDAMRDASADCPPAQARHRASALHPLHERHDRQAEGHPAHDRRLSHPRRHHRQGDLRPEGRRHLLVYGRPRLGHRPLLRRLRDPRQRRDHADVRGRADPPAPRPLLGHHRAPPRHDLLHRADGDPHLHPAGRRAPEEARSLVAAPARHGRRADQSRGVDVVPPRDRRQALPDRRHLVADGDRRDHDHAAARRRRRPSPAPRRCRSPASTPPSTTDDGKPAAPPHGGFLVLRRPWPGMLRGIWGDPERYQEQYWSRFEDDLLHRRRRAPRQGRLLLDHGPRRRRDERRRATASARWRSRARWCRTRRSPRPPWSGGRTSSPAPRSSPS